MGREGGWKNHFAIYVDDENLLSCYMFDFYVYFCFAYSLGL